jgi:unsaturated rhamnogalacturonyl hydrolase
MNYRLCSRAAIFAALLCAALTATSQTVSVVNSNAIPLNRAKPAYPVPYPPASVEEITAVLDRVADYLAVASPIRIVDRDSGQTVSDLTKLPKQVALERGDFSLISYEWGVTYAGMLLAGEATGDSRFKDFAARRFDAIRALAAHFQALPATEVPQPNPLRNLLTPSSLDDCGAMAAAMLKAQQAGVGGNLKPLTDTDLAYISAKQMRLPDGTLDRNRPLPNSVWLDDLYMSVPALAQMGRSTGETKYFDDAVKQLLQFSQRLFIKEKGLYTHGWIEQMQEHPCFHWGRANGWAAMATVELLSVLPENHPGRGPVLELLRQHLRGLAAVQGKNGLWHQLLDRPDTFEETSASAMFVFAAARAINRGWVDPLVYGPMTSLGWNAVAGKVNAQGQVEGTCIGTGLGWEPMFYAYRPTSALAAHGYGPTLLAGAEMITLRRGKGAAAGIHDDAVHFGKNPALNF